MTENMENLNILYSLQMMEAKDIGIFEVTRVPGGWIFKSETKHYEKGFALNGSESVVFVPYAPRKI